MKKINNIFQSLLNGIQKGMDLTWHYTKVSFEYVKENAWIQPLIIVVLLFGLIFGLTKVIDGVQDGSFKFWSSEETEEHSFTTITHAELEQKRDNNEDFIFMIGSDDCPYCIDYYETVNRYVDTFEEEFFHIDVTREGGSFKDPTIESRHADDMLEELQELWHIDYFDDVTGLSTPTTVIVRNGEFVDAIVGDVTGTEFLDFVEGKSIPD